MSWVEKNWKPLTVVGGLIGLSWFVGKKFDEADTKRLTITAESLEAEIYDRLSAEGYRECCTKDNIRVHHRGGAIYHDDEAELTYYPAECMVCGREYEAGLPMYSSSTEIVKLDAEALVIPDGDSVPYHILKRLDKEGIRYRWIEGNYEAESFDAEGFGNSHINQYKWSKEGARSNTLTKEEARTLLETTTKPIKMRVGRSATLYVGRAKVLPNTPQVIGRDEALAFFDNEGGSYVGVNLWEYDDHIFLNATTYSEMWAESFDAESVSDLELQKDSCCCGATKKTPCLCMIQGTEQCSAKAPMCPCYAEIAMGTKVEMEHTKSREKAEKIAKEHLSEHPDYYSRLKSAGLSAETFNATTNSKKSEIVPFSPIWKWMGKHFPLLDSSHTQIISKIVDGEVLKEPNSIVVNYPITRRDIEPITMKWGELFKICRENNSKKIYTVSFGEGGQKYDTPFILSALKYLPKKTVLTIYADHNYPLEVIFDYGGEKWVYRQSQTIEHDEYKPKKTQKRGRKKNRNRIKTRFEMDPDMRLNSASNPNNPSVGSIEKECLVEGCSEKVRVNHEIEDKRCFKCYNDMMEERGYYRRLDTRYVKGEKRPPWDETLMEGAIVKDEDGSFERFSKDKAVLLFRKSGKSEQLKSLLKHINSMNYELLSNEGLRELLLDLRTYRTLDLGDNGESGEYIVIDDTPFSQNHFHQMLRKLPPLTKLRISGKRDSPLMVEFNYLGEEYIMFLAPYEVDYEDSRMVKSVENHPEFPFWVVKKPNPEKMEKDFQAMLNEDRKKATERVKKRERLRKLRKEARKVMTPEESEEIWNLRVSGRIRVDDELEFYEDILRERKEAETFEASTGDIEMDRTLLKEQIERFKDDPEMLEAIENMVQMYGVAGALNNMEMLDRWLGELEREEKEEQEKRYRALLRRNKGLTKELKKDPRYRSPFKAESFGAWDANCSLCNGTGWMPKKGDPKKDAKLAKLLGLSIDELTLTPCKAGGKSKGCWSENNSSRLRRLQRAESRPASYMVKSDAHKLNEAARRIHEKADEHQKYPEWWKSKLSVSRNNADQLADFLDYAVIENVFASEGHDHDDHDHEDIDELITKLNTVVDFAITFIHDGGYGGEPKGIFVDDDLGIKTEVVEYVEGSIQLRLVRDIETNELLSVRFSLTGNPEETPIVYLPLPEKLTTIPDDERSSK